MIPTIDSFDFRGKTVLVRVDLNSPYDAKKKKILDDERIKCAPVTIKELVKKKAKIVLLAHQGRQGEEDFISLAQHAKLLEKHLKMPVHFVADVIGEKAKTAIKKMKPGDVLLLDNVRFVKDEEDKEKAKAGKSLIVKELAPLADFFVNDAFSVSHRAQGSVIGFAAVLPSCFGRLMEKELKAVETAFEKEESSVLVLGGAKSEECVNILEHNFNANPKSISHALLCGVTANIFLKAKGIEIGEKSEKLIAEKNLAGLVEKAGKLLEKHSKKIILPKDVAIELDKKRKEVPVTMVPKSAGILDIGSITIKEYEKIIRKAKTIIVKGPAGLYEDKRFRKGTKQLFACVANSKAYSVVGGGDTTEALDILKIDKKKISHISLGGGALITYLSGEPMPGIEAIKTAKQ
jgi:phosphoglycerate kinase